MVGLASDASAAEPKDRPVQARSKSPPRSMPRLVLISRMRLAAGTGQVLPLADAEPIRELFSLNRFVAIQEESCSRTSPRFSPYFVACVTVTAAISAEESTNWTQLPWAASGRIGCQRSARRVGR